MGWTDDGMSLFHGVEIFFKKAREKTEDWEKLKVSCRMYFVATMQYRHDRRTMRNGNPEDDDANSELYDEKIEAPELDGIACDFYKNEDLEHSNSESNEGDGSQDEGKDNEEDDGKFDEGEAWRALIGLDGGSGHEAV